MNSADRSLPHSTEAERSVLGAILLDSELLSELDGHLDPDDFYQGRHRHIFRAMLTLGAAGSPIDLLTLTEYLRDHDQLSESGGVDYLGSLDTEVPNAAHATSYAQIVREKAALRRMIQAASAIQSEALAGPGSVAEFLDRAEASVFGVSQSQEDKHLTKVGSVAQEVFRVLEERHAHAGEITGVSTGFSDLDRKTSGLQPGDLLILAARPSMGKTALALNIASNAALRANAKVAVFSLEMTTLSLVMRLYSSVGRVKADHIRTGRFVDSDWQLLGKAAEKLQDAGLYIDDTPAITLSQLRSKSRRLKARDGLDLIMVDYLQLMRGPKSDSREQEIASISRGLKELAKELEVPVLALSQLNRSVESRKDKRPMLSDLRESGAIEQDADVILFIHREDRYRSGSDEGEVDRLAELLIAKQRNGPTGMVELYFFDEYTRFDNYDRGHDLP